MRIEIENPCHENWDAMTPNKIGAFCYSCKKDVIDFSKKSVNEIKSFFNELPSTESVCGRFKEKQLNAITFDHFFAQFRYWNWLHKVSLIIFFTFGFTLFGVAQNHPKDKHLSMKGEVAIVLQDTSKQKYDPKKPKANEEIMMLGGPRIIPNTHPVKEDPKKKPLMGKPAIQRDPH